MLYPIWKARNNKQFQSEDMDCHTSVQRALGEWNEYELNQQQQEKQSLEETQRIEQPGWSN